MGTDAPTLRTQVRLPPYRSPLEASAGLWRSKRLLPLGTVEGAGHEFTLDRALLDELARNFDAADAPLLLTLGRGNQPSWDPERQIGQVVDLVAMDDGLHAVLELSRAADEAFVGSPTIGLSPVLTDEDGSRKLALVNLPTHPEAAPPRLDLTSPRKGAIDLINSAYGRNSSMSNYRVATSSELVDEHRQALNAGHEVVYFGGRRDRPSEPTMSTEDALARWEQVTPRLDRPV